MLQSGTLSFLTALGQNNNKPWFDEHRNEYETAKADFEQFTAGILSELGKTEPSFAEQKAKDCIFRIYRDVRFSNDKSPYKANFGAFFSKGGKKYSGAGYYLHLEPGKSMAGGGLWMPEAPILKAVRQEIDYNFEEFNALVNQPSFKKYFNRIEGDQVKKVPQGFSADSPAAEYLKLKSFTVHNMMEDKSVLKKDFSTQLISIFDAMRPLVDFINRAVEDQQEK